MASTTTATSTNSKPASSGLGGFDDLWGSASGSKKDDANASKGKMTMAQMAKDKSQSSVWGGGMNQQSQSSGSGQGQKKDLFDLL